VHFVGLYCIIILQCTVQKTFKKWHIFLCQFFIFFISHICYHLKPCTWFHKTCDCKVFCEVERQISRAPSCMTTYIDDNFMLFHCQGPFFFFFLIYCNELLLNKSQIHLQTNSVRATEQPRVPEPRSKHRVFFITSRSSWGIKRHFISFRFKCTDVSANLKVINLILV